MRLLQGSPPTEEGQRSHSQAPRRPRKVHKNIIGLAIHGTDKRSIHKGQKPKKGNAGHLPRSREVKKGSKIKIESTDSRAEQGSIHRRGDSR